MKNEEIEAIFAQKRASSYYSHKNQLRQLDEQENTIKEDINLLRKNGIVLLQHREVVALNEAHGIDLYKVFAAKCKTWGRPYIKCTRLNYSRIVLVANGTGSERRLVANLLLTAEHMKPLVEYSKKAKREITHEPNVIENKYTGYSEAPVQSWVTARTVTIRFQSDAGIKTFKDWQEFCLTDRMQRLYLGL